MENKQEFEYVYLPPPTPPLDYITHHDEESNIQINNICHYNRVMLIDYIYQNTNNNFIINFLENLISSKEIIYDLLMNIKPIELEILFNYNNKNKLTIDQKIFVNKLMHITGYQNLINLFKRNANLIIGEYHLVLIKKIIHKINQKYNFQNNINCVNLFNYFVNEYLIDLNQDEINRQVFYLLL